MGEGNSFSLLVCPHTGGRAPQGRYPPPSQVRMGGGGVLKVGTPGQGRYPTWPGQDGGGYPKVGTPFSTKVVTPLAKLEWGEGVPPPPPFPPPRICYTAGSMPLAFTQEDFLVPQNKEKRN